MAIIVHKLGEAWVRFTSTLNLDAPRVAALVDQGTWTTDDLEPHGLRVAEPFVVPHGKRITGPEMFVEVDGVVQQTFSVEDIPAVRRMVRKSTVQQRLIDAGLIDTAFSALQADPAAFARWFAPDRPSVYADDPDSLALLQSIGADPEAIMAAEDV